MERIKRYYTSLFFSNFNRHFLYYIFYCFLAFLLHSVMVSVVIFFHLLLDHKMEIIDDWIYNNGWFFLVISKIFSLYIVLKFVNANISFRDTFRRIRLINNFFLDKEILVTITFIISFFVYLGEPVETAYSSFHFGKIFASFVGMLVMYLTDMYLFNRVGNYYPLGRKIDLIIYPLFSIIFFFSFKWTYMYGKNINSLLLFIFIVAFLCTNWKGKRFINSAWFIISISSVCAWYGIGPMWGSAFSPARMRGDLSISYLILLLVMLLIYLKIRSRRSFRSKLITS